MIFLIIVSLLILSLKSENHSIEIVLYSWAWLDATEGDGGLVAVF